VRSGDVTLDQVIAEHPHITHLVISPGPGHPLRDSGISIPAIQHYAGKIPILGVCMGLQCMFAAYGGTVDRVGEIVHGKTSVLKHDGKGLFYGIKDDIQGTRYHSLAGTYSTVPDELEVTCRTPRIGQKDGGQGSQEGIVMGIRHKTLAMEAVQYHPESILSEEGQGMLVNFLNMKAGTWEQNPGFGLSSQERQQAQSSASTTQRAPTAASGSGSAPTILTRIYEQRRRDVELAKATPGSYPSDLTALIDLYIAPPQINFYERILPASTSASVKGSSVALMAEVKRASPSKGDILPPSSPLTSATIGFQYAQAGASVISVLTEPTWFKGTLGDMLAVRNVVATLPNRPAILRKDFVFDTYQIDEARLYGADTVLLIVAMLDDHTLKHLYDYARYIRGMEPLVEVNNPEELERALKVGAKVVGVNNRNLHDFNVDMGTTSRIAEVINSSSSGSNGSSAHGQGQVDNRKVILCALSGITGREDVVKYVDQGVGAVLVGEALMRAEDKGKFVRTLLGTEQPTSTAASSTSRSSFSAISKPKLTAPPDAVADPESFPPTQNGSATSAASADTYKPLVKICGIKTVEAALAAAEAGADFIGLIFAPKSKRYVELSKAKNIVDAVRARAPSVIPPNHDTTPSAGSASPASTDYFAIQSQRLATTTRKPLIVGVFQNAPLATVLDTLDALQLDVVQLHGSEPAEWCRLLGVPTFKAFHVDENVESTGQEQSLSSASSATRLALQEAARPGYHSIPLLDTKVSAAAGGTGLSGGAGRAFDWSIAARLTTQDKPGLPIVLAGGLEIENVAGAVRAVRPWAIDVSGGVETDGSKDLGKIKEFVAKAKGAVLEV